MFRASSAHLQEDTAVYEISPPPFFFCTHTDINIYIYSRYIVPLGTWGSVVVKADGLGIDSRWCNWIFQ